jgi:hypothetical protein
MRLPEDEDPAAPPPSAPGADTLFPGDSGELHFDTRRVLCQLLLGPYLDAQRHSALWHALERDENRVRSRLSELFLELVLDRELGVAFTRRAETGDLEAPTMLRSSPLTFIDSVLLLALRRRLSEADTQGERAAIDGGEIHEQLSIYQRTGVTDAAGFGKRVAAAIEKMKKNSVLQKLRGSDDRFEISPTLKLLFSAEQVHALAQTYRARLGGTSGSTENDGEEGDDE